MPILGTLPRIQQPITDISATSTINWLGGPIFSRSIGGNMSFIFSNENIGQEIQVILHNSSVSVVEATFAPSSLDLRWEKGEVQDRVGGRQSTIFKFVNFGTFILASVISERIAISSSENALVDNFYMSDPSDIGYSLNKWEIQDAGTSNISYEASTDSGMGYGRYAFDGNGTWHFRDFIPTMPFTGAGGFGLFKKSLGTANIYLGARCFSANKNDLLENRYFVTQGESVTTSWSLAQGRAKNEGVSMTENFPTGTRFIKPLIIIENYTGTSADKVYLSGFNIFTSNFSTVADYA